MFEGSEIKCQCFPQHYFTLSRERLVQPTNPRSTASASSPQTQPHAPHSQPHTSLHSWSGWYYQYLTQDPTNAMFSLRFDFNIKGKPFHGSDWRRRKASSAAIWKLNIILPLCKKLSDRLTASCLILQWQSESKWTKNLKNNKNGVSCFCLTKKLSSNSV